MYSKTVINKSENNSSQADRVNEYQLPVQYLKYWYLSIFVDLCSCLSLNVK